MREIGKTRLPLVMFAMVLVMAFAIICGTGDVLAKDTQVFGDWQYEETIGSKLKITGYTGNDTNISIPEEINGKKVEVIGENAFSKCKNLVEIMIPKGIYKIEKSFGSDDEYRNFRGCSSLERIIVDEENEYYSSEDGALYDKKKTELLICPNGKSSIFIPESVNKLRYEAFSECNNLTSILIPAGVQDVGKSFLGYYTFSGCNRLEEILVSEENPYFSSENGMLFDKNKTELICCPEWKSEVIMPEGIKRIGDHAFAYCEKLRSITIPEGVKEICPYTFYNCAELEVVDIPRSTTYLTSYAFWNCKKLKSITIPEKVRSIFDTTFLGCENLKEIIVADGNEYYSSEDGVLYDKEKTSLELCFDKSKTNFVIPDGIKTISPRAFADCKKLDDITIPNGVTSIYSDTFERCSNLKSITIPDGVTSIATGAFDGCENLEVIILPKSVTKIGSDGFEDSFFAVFKDCAKLTIYCNKDSYAQQYAELYQIPYKFLEKSIDNVEGEITLPERGYKYGGDMKTPKIMLKYDGVLLSEGKDYTVNYENNVNAGTAHIIVTGCGDYMDTKTFDFTIGKSEQVITASNIKKTYGDKAFKLNVTQNFGDGKLQYQSKDRNVATVNSNGNVTIKGCGKTSITITAAESDNFNKCSKKIYITVSPKKAQIKNAISKKKGQIDVSWKKDNKASGYVVKYVCGKSSKTKIISKNSVTKLTLKNLKPGKKYKISVCSYKTIGKEKLYGKYSAAKTVAVRAK